MATEQPQQPEKQEKTKRARRFRFRPAALSVTSVWVIIFASGVLLTVAGIVWAFFQYLSVTSNEYAGTGAETTDRAETINREELDATIKQIEQRRIEHDDLRTNPPSIPSPSVAAQNENVTTSVDGPVTSE